MNYRCGYCSSPGPEGRCGKCGSGMDLEDNAINGSKYPERIKKWLRSRDKGWELFDAARNELMLRLYEDYKEGRDWKRFDGQVFDWKD